MNNFLDVTTVEPSNKHPEIFRLYEELDKSESLTISNDHDPKPLYYQFLAEKGETFDWEYQADGPETWKVKITKLPEGEKPSTVGELVASDYRKAQVFKNFGIDFCCGGKKSISKACSQKGVDTTELLKALQDIDNKEEKVEEDYNSWPLDRLVNHIINKHHSYVLRTTPTLYEYLQKVARVHGEQHPEMVEVHNLFINVVSELNSHMQREEIVLFPYISSLQFTDNLNGTMEAAPFGTVKNPIQMMEAEHDSAGDDMAKIQELTNNFTPPQGACNTFRVSISLLEEFADDLHQHIHLENNILFPKAIALEEKLMDKQ